MHIAIIGGGPAGLRAAEVAAGSGATVTVYEAQPSVGRKFLVAGRGGLNLTHAEPLADFIARYHGAPPDGWDGLLAEFSPDALRAWAADLGVETFAAGTGRVYPKALKGAPLLRRWVLRLRALGVRFATRHRWTGLTPGAPHALHFTTPDGPATADADAVILALGGASWPQTGSDGGWLSVLAEAGVACAPLVAANCGWEFPWPPAVLAAAEGAPLKNLVVRAGGRSVSGELLVTRHGLEGGAIYALGRELRASTVLTIDFKPTFTVDSLLARLGTVHGELLAHAARRWKLTPAMCALLEMRAPFAAAPALAAAVKNFALTLTGPRPLAEAISSAGGVRWDALTADLMLTALPGVFVAGEMIDWEAPTGGYLLQGCFATGTRAGRAAAAWAQRG
jgi:uncharacterized flavoprotein (TIGR03862 family)